MSSAAVAAVAVGTAASLAGLAEAQKLGPPAVILVGEAVRGREAIDWFEQRPLFGRRIITTRGREQAGELRRKLEDLGADVLELALFTPCTAAQRKRKLRFEARGNFGAPPKPPCAASNAV